MKTTPFLLALVFEFALLCKVSASIYMIQDTFIGTAFLDAWNWETFDDPTHGRVNYVDLQTALAQNLTYADSNKFVMRADATQMVPTDSRGRNSVRITSKAAYDDSIMTIDLQHMPYGCGTWPAWWTLSQQGPWPNYGEVDIIEGVNQDTQNLVSLHTTTNCTMNQNRYQTGYTVSTNCDAAVNYNQGCGTRIPKSNSYGSGFNVNGGGWFVMHKSRDMGVRVWFWSRSDPSVPSAITSGSPVLTYGDMDSWGTPDANFPPDTCQYDTHFNAHQMVFDLTFCGDWAGSGYSKAGCPGSCVDFVNNNPGSFLEAYWEVNALRVYSPFFSGVPV
ncbi:hypothetical protein HGRIS_002439 [Hohenbuehelia grisea]|uniref:GH16 domain-containing protein n=1 Tax=Hohenbuehelia grisea TaxID=104357 RepID=A0ABR3JKM4_9AGAR